MSELWQPGSGFNWYERAQEIVALGYPAVSDHLDEILVWLQDMNWPGARTIADFLITVGAPLVPHVKKVLTGKDEDWIYSVLTQLVNHWPRELVSEIEPELMHFANMLYNSTCLDIEALRLLTKHRLGDEIIILRSIAYKKSEWQSRLSDLQEIERNLSS